MIYNLDITVVKYGNVQVEADSLEEAEDKVIKMDSKNEIEYFFSEVSDFTITEV